MESLQLDSITENISYTGDLYLDSSFVLLPKGSPVTKTLIDSLREWKFESVLCDGSVSIGDEIETDSDEEIIRSEPQRERIGESIKKAIENSRQTVFDNSDKTRLEAVQVVYDEYMNYIEEVFTHYTTHKEIDQEDLAETVQQFCIFIKENRRFILRISPTTESSGKNFIVIHAMRSTVLAIAISMQLHMPLSKMIELGVTCILHEIGMLRLPPQLYNSTKKLTPGQRAQISKHTVYGYTIIKDLNFPLPVQLGVLEHHEKENGTGYPRHLPGEKISPIAKIIAVACSYEAISSQRSYKDERSTFDALLEMIHNKNHQYNDNVLKALLYTVSLYPIGTYVYLSNRKVAVVVDSNQKNPKCPIVQMLTEKEADGSQKTIQTNEELSILRILTKTEKEDILKILDEKEKAISEAKKLVAEGKSAFDKPNPATQKQPHPVATESKTDANGTEEVDINFFN